MCKEPELLSMQELFFERAENYTIPMYQRNYAWRDSEITQLITDIVDYAKKNHRADNPQNYYLGTLIVYTKKQPQGIIYETIDGQQRLTTLWLLFQCLKHMKDWRSKDISMTLSYECRPSSSATLNQLANYGDYYYQGESNCLLDGYNTIKNQLNFLTQKLDEISKNQSEQFTKDDFLDYFLKYVTLVRVSVPQDTDLNHYFEIMNSRGEQLEKHEVLKATMMQVLTEADGNSCASDTFSQIWNACYDMSRYIQMNFDKSLRIKLFGEEWDRVVITSFSKLIEYLHPTPSTEDENVLTSSLDPVGVITFLDKTEQSDKAIVNGYEIDEDSIDEGYGKYAPIINFPNFLLHVLRIMVLKNDTVAKYRNDVENDDTSKGDKTPKEILLETKDVSLDDKLLIDQFMNVLGQYEGKEKAQFVKDFCVNLLRLRFWLDNYIIKRNTYKNEWSLKRLRATETGMSYTNLLEGDRTPLMLQSMLHVSHSTYNYKQWLSGLLRFGHDNITSLAKDYADNYLAYIKQMTKNFMRYRFLSKERKLDYKELLFLPQVEILNQYSMTLNLDNLTYDNNIEYLVFNYIDYLYWCNCLVKKESKTTEDKVIEEVDKNNPEYISGDVCRDFVFSVRSSVEHHYPRNPLPGFPRIDNCDVIDSIGNLCLVTVSTNSRLSNHTPEAKGEACKSMKGSVDSLKRRVMSQYKTWDSESIIKHADIVKKMLKDDLLYNEQSSILDT